MGQSYVEAMAEKLFGDTDEAGCIPGFPAPSDGPVYLEGRLVLSLSFARRSGERGGPACEPCAARNCGAAPDGPCAPAERYRIWDDLAGDWYPDGLELRRLERIDEVMPEDGIGTPIWSGSVDTHARIIVVPDLDDEGAAANEMHDLRWKRV